MYCVYVAQQLSREFSQTVSYKFHNRINVCVQGEGKSNAAKYFCQHIQKSPQIQIQIQILGGMFTGSHRYIIASELSHFYEASGAASVPSLGNRAVNYISLP